MSIVQKLAFIATNNHKIYDAGFTAANDLCAQKHFCTTATGNGEETISFHIPFRPDSLLVFVSEVGMYGKLGNNAFVSMFQADLAGFGLVAGRLMVFHSTSEKGATFTTTSIYQRYNQADDGTVTLQNLLASSTPGNAKFIEGAEYVIVAVKYATKPDKERITEYVRSLSSAGGSVTLNKAKVNAAFTDAEWAALIAEKPNWTFSFI